MSINNAIISDNVNTPSRNMWHKANMITNDIISGIQWQQRPRELDRWGVQRTGRIVLKNEKFWPVR